MLSWAPDGALRLAFLVSWSTAVVGSAGCPPPGTPTWPLHSSFPPCSNPHRSIDDESEYLILLDHLVQFESALVLLDSPFLEGREFFIDQVRFLAHFNLDGLPGEHVARWQQLVRDQWAPVLQVDMFQSLLCGDAF
jgi:hypothetical protein